MKNQTIKGIGGRKTFRVWGLDISNLDKKKIWSKSNLDI